LDYEALKRCIKDCREEQREAAAQPELACLLDARQAVFRGRLDSEVLKVLGFYQQCSRELLQRVEQVAGEVGAVLEPGRLGALPRGAERAAALDAAAQAVHGLIRETTQLLQASATGPDVHCQEADGYVGCSCMSSTPLSRRRCSNEPAHPTFCRLQYVSLNMAALRKALKKYAKNVAATNQPLAGFLALEVEHPDDPGGWVGGRVVAVWVGGWVGGCVH
jgi:hypothetical protein